jgi:hypothetical protein
MAEGDRRMRKMTFGRRYRTFFDTLRAPAMN